MVALAEGTLCNNVGSLVVIVRWHDNAVQFCVVRGDVDAATVPTFSKRRSVSALLSPLKQNP